MDTEIRLPTHLAKPLLALMATLAMAQNPMQQSRTLYWDGTAPIEVADSSSADSLIHLSKGRVLAPDADLKSLHWFEGRYWARRASTESDVLLSSRDAKHWIEEHRVDRSSRLATSRQFRALGDRRFLVESRILGSPFQEGKDISCYAVVRLDSRNREHMERLIPMEMPKPLHAYPLGFFMARMVPVTDGWAIVHPKTGLTWLVTTSPGLKIRRTALLSEVVDVLQKPKDLNLETAVVAAQSKPDGTLVLVTRTSEGVLKGWADSRHMDRTERDVKPFTMPTALPSRDPDQAKKDLKAAMDGLKESSARSREDALSGTLDRRADDPRLIRQRHSLKTYPDLWWWELDPRTGKATRIPAPPGAPDTLKSLGDFYRIPEGMQTWLR